MVLVDIRSLTRQGLDVFLETLWESRVIREQTFSIKTFLSCISCTKSHKVSVQTEK